MMGTTQELRQAAETLRRLVEAAQPYEGDEGNRPWVEEYDPVAGEREHGYYSHDAAYIQKMHPGVGLLVADLLDREADERDVTGGCESGYGEAVRLARALNGGAA